MAYKELPPLEKSDETFVNEMVNDYITNVCMKETLMAFIILHENQNPNKIEDAYDMLTEAHTNVDQINISLQSKISYPK